ncbi:lipopolysaccharide-induced tumor necrosis factor-alpha factor homolog isoform X5 [Oratosquilla oratoria]|uniref:lipopolysaccharide-induced tumor necrosis factor-alpha factor homolog isoform X5 n=1 Tax=Oratosquilla oratoria TaxID=337810 RepID=UPI003F760552
MSKATAPPYNEPPPCAPPSYSEAVGGVPPQAPFTPSSAGYVPAPPVYIPEGIAVQQAAVHPQTSTVYQSVPTAIVTTVVPLGPQSTHMICPHCHAEVDTATKSEPSLIAYLSGFVIALLGCWMGCCLLPCCIPECMNVQHTCPNCRAFLGKYKRG